MKSFLFILALTALAQFSKAQAMEVSEITSTDSEMKRSTQQVKNPLSSTQKLSSLNMVKEFPILHPETQLLASMEELEAPAYESLMASGATSRTIKRTPKNKIAPKLTS